MSYLFASRNSTRIYFGVLFATPLFLALVSGIFESARIGPPARWLRVCELAFLGWVVYVIATPFIMEAIHRRGGIKRTPKLAPEQLILLLGVAPASSITMLAFLLMLFGGATANWVYVSAPISIGAALYWSWRYREVLR